MELIIADWRWRTGGFDDGVVGVENAIEANWRRDYAGRFRGVQLGSAREQEDRLGIADRVVSSLVTLMVLFTPRHVNALERPIVLGPSAVIASMWPLTVLSIVALLGPRNQRLILAAPILVAHVGDHATPASASFLRFSWSEVQPCASCALSLIGDHLVWRDHRRAAKTRAGDRVCPRSTEAGPALP